VRNPALDVHQAATAAAVQPAADGRQTRRAAASPLRLRLLIAGNVDVKQALAGFLM
jgi:hypothetical protein